MNFSQSGHSPRVFFLYRLSISPEEIITTWENRWDTEVMIREVKALGLENGSFKTWRRNIGYVKLI
ncbi:hypothetical protein L3N51_02269 [Metallosphaera sp. J1]|nr:hypothetical protein [Metallosphaera javensis (ex Hofmann et al. 2022)]BCS94368.1 MAG: hypothetical protein MjAS7_2976 [Metallosphaera javensis (ex Sakai et al. 2022)]